jgi:hypothetical protein
VAYNFQTGNNKIKLLMEYMNVTQKVLSGNAVHAALISRRKYGVIPQNDVVWFFETKSVIKSQRHYRIHLQIKQFQETGTVLNQKETGRTTTWHEDVDRILEAWTSSMLRKVLKLFSILQN